MKLKALHGFCIGNSVDVAQDEVFDVISEQLCREWIANGFAVEYVAPVEAGEAPAEVAPKKAFPESGEPGAAAVQPLEPADPGIVVGGSTEAPQP